MFRFLQISVCLAILTVVAFHQGLLGAAEPDSVENNSGPVRLLLPSVIPSVVGQECNVYFDNVTLVVNPANWVFDVNSPKGRQQVERWTWTPTEKEMGDHGFVLNVLNQENQLVASARSTIRVVAADRNQDLPLSVLCIGDSLTHASVYPQRLLDLCSQPGNPKLALVGTHWTGEPGPNRHEGYGGWTAKRFATHFTETSRTGPYTQRGSPFLYKSEEGKLALDFARYCLEVNEGKFPDVATIFLGPNDIFHYNDQTIEAGIDDMLQHMDLLLEMLRKENDVTKIALMLAVPPAATQDAFGANYSSGNTRWQYKRNQHRLLERMIEKYSHREGERIYLVPTYINLDCLNNYPSAVSAANANSDVKVTRLNNGVHPAKSGYNQIGDTLFAWLKGL
ncbi:MAG: hypothetical protein KDA68_00875 [Planctomycetaceae bacterium]|nr:hypothetical protein [Planctomycetaceae bacterium]